MSGNDATDWSRKDGRSRLCSLLGLKRDFLDRLNEMPSHFRDHWTLDKWIVTFLSNNCKSVGSVDQNTLSKELLHAIGFDPMGKSAEIIMARSYEASTQHHVESCEWAEIFVQDELKYNPLLSPALSKFPFQCNLTNVWFQLPIRVPKSRNNNDNFYNVNIMNAATKDASSAHQLFVRSDFTSQDERNILLFHGTDHLSAADILERGIDLCAGRQKRDFSCGSGFYLTKSFEEALNWAKSTTAKPAILVFQVDSEYLNDARQLNLFGNERIWREIVSSFRSGKRTAKTRKSLRLYDFIEGPMATVRRSDNSDELVFEPKPLSYEMCLISDDFAEDFQQTLHSVFFLDISET